MANGSMLQELRDVLESSTQVSNRVATRLTLSAVAEILQRMTDTDKRQDELHKSITDRIEAIEKTQESAGKERAELHESMDKVLKFTAFLAENPMVLMSSWMLKHKKVGGAVMLFVGTTIALWMGHVWAEIDYEAIWDWASKIIGFFL